MTTTRILVTGPVVPDRDRSDWSFRTPVTWLVRGCSVLLMTCAHVQSRHEDLRSCAVTSRSPPIPFFPILLSVDDSLSKHCFFVLIEVCSCRGNYRSLELTTALNTLLFDLHRSTNNYIASYILSYVTHVQVGSMQYYMRRCFIAPEYNMIYNILCYITPPYYSTPCGYISAVFACYIANSHSGTRIQVTEAAAAAHDSVDSEVTDSEVCHCASGSGPGKPRLGPAD